MSDEHCRLGPSRADASAPLPKTVIPHAPIHLGRRRRRSNLFNGPKCVSAIPVPTSLHRDLLIRSALDPHVRSIELRYEIVRSDDASPALPIVLRRDDGHYLVEILEQDLAGKWRTSTRGDRGTSDATRFGNDRVRSAPWSLIASFAGSERVPDPGFYSCPGDAALIAKIANSTQQPSARRGVAKDAKTRNGPVGPPLNL